jgi:hypothetical protein
VAAEGVVVEHVVEGGLETWLRHLPGDERAAREVRRHQRLSHAADRAGAHHRGDAFDDDRQLHAGLLRDRAERVRLEPLDLVLRHRKDAGVDGVARFDGDGEGTHAPAIVFAAVGEVVPPSCWAIASSDNSAQIPAKSQRPTGFARAVVRLAPTGYNYAPP